MPVSSLLKTASESSLLESSKSSLAGIKENLKGCEKFLSKNISKFIIDNDLWNTNLPNEEFLKKNFLDEASISQNNFLKDISKNIRKGTEGLKITNKMYSEILQKINGCSSCLENSGEGEQAESIRKNALTTLSGDLQKFYFDALEKEDNASVNPDNVLKISTNLYKTSKTTADCTR